MRLQRVRDHRGHGWALDITGAEIRALKATLMVFGLFVTGTILTWINGWFFLVLGVVVFASAGWVSGRAIPYNPHRKRLLWVDIVILGIGLVTAWATGVTFYAGWWPIALVQLVVGMLAYGVTTAHFIRIAMTSRETTP
jgi:hypothetical protein